MFKIEYTATLKHRDLADTMAVSKKFISLRRRQTRANKSWKKQT